MGAIPSEAMTRSPDEAKRNPGEKFPHSAEPVLGLAEGETRGLHAGYK
jgi:hypothetical protein